MEPNAVNSVPKRVTLGVDVRDVDAARLGRVVEGVKAGVEEIGRARGVDAGVVVVNHDLPAVSSGAVVEAVGAAVGALGLSSKRMVSRAYHDSLFMARVSEMGMIFIPCEGGKSHRVDEYAKEEDIVRGVQSLAATMGLLSGMVRDDVGGGVGGGVGGHDEL